MNRIEVALHRQSVVRAFECGYLAALRDNLPEICPYSDELAEAWSLGARLAVKWSRVLDTPGKGAQ